MPFALEVLALAAMNSAHAEMRFGGALGYQHWEGISDLRPAAGGRFDSGELVLDVSVHWRLNRFEDRRIMIGLQAGGGGDYSSDIQAFAGDLRASTSYVSGSAIVAIADKGFIEIGAGSYRVTMRDSRVFGQSDLLPDDAPRATVHEQREAGLFVGGGVEFGESDKLAWTIGAKLHLPDFGEVHELEPGAGSLSEPMLTLQFGVRYIL